jgi:hypothetical protein
MLTKTSPEFLSFFAVCASRATQWRLDVTEGDKWLKVIKFSKETGERSNLPYCFIDRESGDIYLGANWKFPKKNFTRGNLFAADNGLAEMGPDGVRHRQAGCPKGFKHNAPRKTPIRKKKLQPEASFETLTPLITVPKNTGMVPAAVGGRLPVRTFTPKSQVDPLDDLDSLFD